MTQEDYSPPSAEWIEARENDTSKHSVWVNGNILNLCNNDDGYYFETFDTREELELFIAYLQMKADEAWPR